MQAPHQVMGAFGAPYAEHTSNIVSDDGVPSNTNCPPVSRAAGVATGWRLSDSGKVAPHSRSDSSRPGLGHP